MDLLNQFEDYIIKEELIDAGDSLILGVSGGPDSLTMLDLFARISEKYQLVLRVFHLNHMFRKEAGDEALFVKKKAEEYGVWAVIEEFNVPEYIKKENLSPEEGAREARFKLIAKWAEKFDIKKVAVAHNKDDLVETVFLNLIRGAGLTGLIGIKPLTQNYGMDVIHPLLGLSREDIEYYCRERDLKPRIDPSNQELIYTRNRIRNLILPQIEETINAGVKDSIYRMASNIRDEEEFLQRYSFARYQQAIVEKNNKRIDLSLILLQKEESVIRRRILICALKDLDGNVTDLYSVHYQALEELILSGDTGKTIQLREDNIVRTSYDRVIIKKESFTDEVNDYLYELEVPGSVETSDFMISSELIKKEQEWRKLAVQGNICLADFNKLSLPLRVRNRQDGDFFIPFGMKGSKKLKDFFIDEKIPVELRDRIPLVVDSKGKILWIAGYRTDDRIKVEHSTEKILKLSIVYKGCD
ncbi:MAG: tRNA lysidine(34) synthetase TilS [Halanaerobiales bacterium]